MPKHFAPVWKHFSRNLPVGRSKHHRAQCIYCKYELSGQPERMKAHLRKCKKLSIKLRASILKEYSAPDNPHFDSTHRSPTLKNNTQDSPIIDSDIDSNRIPSSANHSITFSTSLQTDHNSPLSFEDQINNFDTYPRNEILPKSVQGLLGLSWDRSERSIMNSYTEEYNPNSQYNSNFSLRNNPRSLIIENSQHPFSQPEVSENEDQFIRNNVRNYYSNLPSPKNKHTFVASKIVPHPIIKEIIKLVPEPVKERSFGFGIPIPLGIEGLRVLDLGCGSGLDCYIASKLVGPTGNVTGIDMSEQVLAIAKNNIPAYSSSLGFHPHLNFIQGYNELLADSGLFKNSFDICISNNAINLSPNKQLCLQSVFDVLCEGGEFCFSDIYADRRIPNHLRTHPTLITENLGGALYIQDFKRICQKIGFVDLRQIGPACPIRIKSPMLRDLVRSTHFYSITFRLFKHTKPSSLLESSREDYGQIAIYKGTIEGQRAKFRLDNDYVFEANRSTLVDGNTAVILSESWIQRHFEVRGDRSSHFGAFQFVSSSSSISTAQYDAWEIENNEDEYYKDKNTNRSSSTPQDCGLVASSKTQTSFQDQDNSPFNLTPSASSNIGNPGLNLSQNSFLSSYVPPTRNKQPQNSVLNLISDTDPTPTFMISASNFFQSNSNTVQSNASEGEHSNKITSSSAIQHDYPSYQFSDPERFNSSSQSHTNRHQSLSSSSNLDHKADKPRSVVSAFDNHKTNGSNYMANNNPYHSSKNYHTSETTSSSVQTKTTPPYSKSIHADHQDSSRYHSYSRSKENRSRNSPSSEGYKFASPNSHPYHYSNHHKSGNNRGSINAETLIEISKHSATMHNISSITSSPKLQKKGFSPLNQHPSNSEQTS
ncbi:hypothetical protein BB560_002112 [Smittium megazygosporum]|uniref:Arsenite methyltransferase n=2 Tax=Smittium megazygosporum TaxID=133381 RepID=A0A2T9ZFL9_9FUNG|nr:hypothetical protein BB560_002112 [Smittium megazygosporum]